MKMKLRLRKMISVFVIAFLMLTSTIVTFADYPIFYQRYTADPSGLEVNGRLYLYCSHDVYDSSKPGYIMNDITCISTDDLKNWTDHGEVFKASGWAGLSWAPSVVAKNNKYYMYFGNGGGSIGVAVSDSPAGPFKDALGKALITGSSPGVNAPSGFWCFDPGAFIDDDGQAYVYFGGNGEGNTRVVKLNSDMISLNGSAQKIVAPIFFEASYMHKYNGKYYFSYSTDFSKGAATIDYMMSDNPMTGFQYKGTVLANPTSNEGNNNHQSIFTFKGNTYIAYHNRAVAIANGASAGDARTYQRSVCIDRVNYNTDGTMQKVTVTQDGLTQLKSVNPFVTYEAETMAQESGINTEECSEGGRDVGYIENGDWIKIRGVDFGTGAASFDARVASDTSGGNIEIRLDSLTGTLVGTCAVSGTGGWQTWTTKSCKVSGAAGKHDVYLKFTGGSGYLFNFNWWKFNSGTTPTPTPTSTPGTSPKSVDVNHDGAANMADIMLVAGVFGSSLGDDRYVQAYDLNDDGAINMSDIMIISAKFNTIVSTLDATPTSKPTPTNTPTSTPGMKAAVKVLPLGDSITDGLNVPGGYRIKLWKSITSNGLNVDYVGSLSNGPTQLGDKNHEGHSGWRIDQIDSNINGWMDTYKPKIVLLHIGTNDISQKYDVTNAPARLSTLIDKICAKLPADGKLYVATIIPLSYADVKTYNAQIPVIVQNKASQGKPVSMVDMYKELTVSDLADGVHPTATGYDKMADTWFNAIKADLAK